MFKDRLIRGVLAGIIAVFGLMGWNLISRYLLHFAKTTWMESMSYMIMGHPPKEFMDYLVSAIFLYIWNGFIGAIFVRFIVPDKEGSYIARAIGLAFITWFFLYGIGTMYHIKTLDVTQWQTVVSNWVGLTGYGVILGWLIKKWDKQGKTRS